MRLVVIAGAIATFISFLGTPLLINLLRRHGYSQAIRASREGELYPAHEGKPRKLFDSVSVLDVQSAMVAGASALVM